MAEVSIIIPTYNRARFLGAAIDSALVQGEGVEIIVVDDGSTDETEAVLARYGDRIRVIRQPNQGPGAARNRGAAEARGNYLFFLDSDDLLEAEAIPSLLAEARSLGPGQLPFGMASTVDEAGKQAPGPAYGFAWAERGRTLGLADLVSNIMPLCLCLVPRVLYLRLGGLSEDLHLGEDHEFALRVHRSGARFVATRMPAILVRLHGGPRLSATHDERFGDKAVQLWQRLADLVKGAADYEQQAASALARMIWVAGRDAARSAQQSPAEALFSLAREVHPAVAGTGPAPLRLLTAMIGPYRAERCLQSLKKPLEPAHPPLERELQAP